MKQTEILTYATHVNGWFPAVYKSCMSQNFRLFHVLNLSVRNFRFLCSCIRGLCLVFTTAGALHAARSGCRAVGGRGPTIGPPGGHFRTQPAPPSAALTLSRSADRNHGHTGRGYMGRKIRKFRMDKFRR